MGREWCSSGGGSSVKRSRGRGSGRKESKDNPYGCMSAVRQLFDFYPFHFAVHHQRQSLKEESTLLEGAEATRNSLESAVLESGPLSSMDEEAFEEYPNIISVGNGIRIETRRDTRKDTRLKVMVPNSRTVELESESGSSPEPKTPNLVCRLMGLESVPETPSPSSSRGVVIPLRKFRKGRGDSGTRSLPETPRRSAARRSSDADPRLSLQLYKESISEEMVARRRELSKRIIGDESPSPGGYVRHVKESVVSRRGFGADITNTTRPRGTQGDELSLSATKSKTKRTNKPCSGSEFLVEESSPRLRISDPRFKPVTTFSATRDRTSHHENPTTPPSAATFSATKDRAAEKHHYKRCVANNPQLPIKSSSKHKPHPQKPIRDCEKAREQCSWARKKQQESIVKPWANCHVKSDRKCKPNRQPPPPPKKKQQEPFVTPWTNCNVKPDRKCKPNRSPPPPKAATQPLPRRTSQWPNNNSASQPHKQETGGRGREDLSKPSTALDGGGVNVIESPYIGTMLKCAGIDRDSQVPNLCRSFTPPLSVRCDRRRLLFHLVEETEVVLGVEEDILESLVRETVAALGGTTTNASVPEIGEENPVQPTRGTLEVITPGRSTSTVVGGCDKCGPVK